MATAPRFAPWSVNGLTAAQTHDGIRRQIHPLAEDRRACEGPRSPARRAHAALLPRTGEQYRFHADMGRCIGCKCCVVAYHEQKGNSASINCRRVGEIEGGFPAASCSCLPMGCNLCADPT
jgi:hypothetical protein